MQNNTFVRTTSVNILHIFSMAMYVALQSTLESMMNQIMKKASSEK